MKLNRAEMGERIRSEILKSGKSQNQIATDAGIGKDTLSDMVNGSQAKLESIVAVADVLGVSLDYLTGRDECKSHDAQSIHEYTGLSDEAIEKLHENKERSDQQLDSLKKYFKDNNAEFPAEKSTFDFLRMTGKLPADLISKIIINPSLLNLISKYFSYTKYTDDILKNDYLNIVDNPSYTKEQNKTRRIIRTGEYHNLQQLVTKGIENMISTEIVNIIKALDY